MATICVIKGVVAWKEAIITKLSRCALKSTLLLFTSRRSKQYNILEKRGEVVPFNGQARTKKPL